MNEDDLTDVQAVIDGPPGTPYQGGQIYSSTLQDRYVSNVILRVKGMRYSVKYTPNVTSPKGGQFRIKLVLSKDFPASPPKGFFLTKIFHPNVSTPDVGT